VTFVATRLLKLVTLDLYLSRLTIAGFFLDAIKTAFAPALTTTDSDFSLADFPGYVACPSDPQPVTLFHQTERDVFVFQGNPFPSPQQTIKASGIATPQTLFGWCMHSSTELLATQVFTTPIPIVEDGDGLAFPLELLAFAPAFLA